MVGSFGGKYFRGQRDHTACTLRDDPEYRTPRSESPDAETNESEATKVEIKRGGCIESVS